MATESLVATALLSEFVCEALSESDTLSATLSTTEKLVEVLPKSPSGRPLLSEPAFELMSLVKPLSEFDILVESVVDALAEPLVEVLVEPASEAPNDPSSESLVDSDPLVKSVTELKSDSESLADCEPRIESVNDV